MNNMKNCAKILKSFVYWVFMAIVVGVITGVVGALFHHAITYATEWREEKEFLIYLLPLGGVAIAFMYRLSKKSIGTNTVIDCIRKSETASVFMAPLIFVSTFITHLFGGSAGREGAALQMGGGIGSRLAYRLKMPKEQRGIMIASGMSGAFSAIFTTPVTATIFALEIVSVGHIRYFQMLPCIISAITGYIITRLMGNHALDFSFISIPEIDVYALLKVLFLAVLCAFLAILFCKSLHLGEKLMKKIAKKDYIRAFSGGVIIVCLTLLVGSKDYNGAGMNIIENALMGKVVPYAFILKMVFTAITIGSGFKGGEIVPAFFVGATFGALVGPFIGLDAGFAAAIALICVFCSATNCPLASAVLGVELFGSAGLVFYVLSCAIAFVVSGNSGLYTSQKIVYAHDSAEKSIHFVE